MKAATITKFLAAAVLISAPLAMQAHAAERESTRLGRAEGQAGIGSLFAVFAAAAAVAGTTVALTSSETPASA